jgi:hypothetical protein
MSAEDWVPDWYPEDEAEECEVECKRCHAAPLFWEQVRVHPGNRNRWVLLDSRGDFHRCPKGGPSPPATADEFPLEP